ncbi:evolutionarily conserved C-terminal region 2 [Quillaja saponaria]|nr:evolutionarily conserved C-terminal region 2 [Quillaja saponaria]
MLHTPYVSGGARLPSAWTHHEIYPAKEFRTSAPSYKRQTVSQNIPYVALRTPSTLEKLPLTFDHRGSTTHLGLRPGYPPSFGSSGNGNLSGNSCMQQGLGFEGIWSDWSKRLETQEVSLAQLSAFASSEKKKNSLGLRGIYFRMAMGSKSSLCALGYCSSFCCKDYPLDGRSCVCSSRSVSTSEFEVSGQIWPTLDEARQGGRCNGNLCNCSGKQDMLSSQTRGPRSSKLKCQTMAYGSKIDKSKRIACTNLRKVHNQLDFCTDFKDAKFFVIKSYSEDNVHKSIKYGVWASTPNGNKKLDAAYREAKEKNRLCPVFLLYSVNASSQFCGVAEMIGHVDFDRSVNYWQQDKWTGQFPVKWHIVKDVPNSQFRHIILENNDNKPVTNSRDTQEVELEHGIEILNIFKSYEACSSILDDFDFYEERQKVMQKRKAKQEANMASTVVAGSNVKSPILLSNGFVNKISKSFAEAVVLNENEKDLSAALEVSTHQAAYQGPKFEPGKKLTAEST